MLRQKNITCIANTTWEGDYAKTIVEMMSVLARENRILFVNYPYTIKDVLQAIRGKIKIPVKRVLGFQNRLKECETREGQRVIVHTLPPLLPVHFLPDGFFFRQLLAINGWIIRRSIKKAQRKTGIYPSDITINAFNPVTGLAMGKPLNGLFLYYCYDEIEAAGWMSKHGAKAEKELMQACDGVIATSQSLFDKKKASADQCFLVKNAVDYQLFYTGFSQTKTKTPKKIGYIGSIDDRLDYGLLEFLFRELPSYQFEFIGRTNYPAGAELLKRHANVSLLGPRQLQELPAMLKEYDAGIIPFACNEFTKGIYPLKINEYLAAGLPVVLTDFGKLEEFASITHIAHSPQEFKDWLIDACGSDSNEKRLQRTDFAKNNSWDKRAEELSVIIEMLFKKNQQ